MIESGKAYITPSHEHARAFREQLGKGQGEYGFIDNMRRDADIITGREVKDDFSDLYIVETSHRKALLASIPAHIMVGKRVHHVIRLFGRYRILSSPSLYERLYRAREGIKKGVLKMGRARRYLHHRIKVVRAYWAYLMQYLPFTSQKSESAIQRYRDIHKGERCFILGTGPSLNQVDLSKIRGEYTIGVNGIYKIAKAIDLDYFIYVSNWYWRHHLEGLRAVACEQAFFPFRMQEELSGHDTKITWIAADDPVYVRFGSHYRVPFAFSEDSYKRLYTGGSVLFVALQLAYYMGFDEVVLLGVDHSYDRQKDETLRQEGGGTYQSKHDDRAHFEGSYLPTGTEFHVDLLAMERGYALAKAAYEKAGRVIYNASPGTRLETFEKRAFDRLFDV